MVFWYIYIYPLSVRGEVGVRPQRSHDFESSVMRIWRGRGWRPTIGLWRIDALLVGDGCCNKDKVLRINGLPILFPGTCQHLPKVDDATLKRLWMRCMGAGSMDCPVIIIVKDRCVVPTRVSLFSSIVIDKRESPWKGGIARDCGHAKTGTKREGEGRNGG